MVEQNEMLKIVTPMMEQYTSFILDQYYKI